MRRFFVRVTELHSERGDAGRRTRHGETKGFTVRVPDEWTAKDRAGYVGALLEDHVTGLRRPERTV